MADRYGGLFRGPVRCAAAGIAVGTLRLAALTVLVALWLAPSALAAGPVVYVDNQSPSVPQADVEAALPAFQLAVSRDLAASWGTDALLTTDPAYADTAQMVVRLEETASCFGCLGYHDVIDNRPTSRVFAGTSAHYNESWQLVFSHELFEMLVDPWVNRFALWGGRMWLVENADPCEDGSYAYFINGVAISDFITPAWYGGVRGKPVDFTHGLRRPGQVGRHGYASWRRADGTWQQTFGFHAPRQRRSP